MKDKDLFAFLLGSRGFLAEHPRPELDCIEAVLNMKPVWAMSKASWVWWTETELHTPLNPLFVDELFAGELAVKLATSD